MTPSEFTTLLMGAAEREREARLRNARLESALLAFGGVKISPLVLIGEEDPHGPNPFVDGHDSGNKAMEQHMLYLADIERKAALRHQRWLPRGIVLDVDDVD
jgi:hypothetical protein